MTGWKAMTRPLFFFRVINKVDGSNNFIYLAVMEEMETRTVKLFFDGKILQTEIKDNLEVDVEDAMENYEASRKLTQGRKYISLVLSAPYTTVTKEARDAMNKPEFYTQNVAQAIVVQTLAGRIMGNFLIHLYRQFCPMRLFTNRTEAVKWLNHHWEKRKQLAD